MRQKVQTGICCEEGCHFWFLLCNTPTSGPGHFHHLQTLCHHFLLLLPKFSSPVSPQLALIWMAAAVLFQLWLIYNVVWLSSVQQSDSYTCVCVSHTHILLRFLFHIHFYRILTIVSWAMASHRRHYFANTGASSQSYFSSSHVWMWEADYKGSWVPKN